MLNQPQQRGLSIEAEATYLVQKKCARCSLSDQTAALRVAKQGALQLVRGQSGTIDDDKWTRCAGR